MPDLRRLTKIAVLPALAVAALSFTTYRVIDAADHFDSPARTDPLVDTNPDFAADIADVFVFHDDTNLNIIVTFAGPAAANAPGRYDRDVLYTINLSTGGSRTDAEFPIEVRFGQNAAGQSGVQVTGLPPNGGTLRGSVESTLTASNGILFKAGLVDDPFFFDLVGFRATRATGTLSFDSNRNFFNGQNDTAIMMQIPRSLLGSTAVDVWATTARFGGNI